MHPTDIKRLLLKTSLCNDAIDNVISYLPTYKYHKNIITNKSSEDYDDSSIDFLNKYMLRNFGWNNSLFNYNQQLTEYYLSDLGFKIFTISHISNNCDIFSIITGLIQDVRAYDNEFVGITDEEKCIELQDYYYVNFELYYSFKYIKKIYKYHKQFMDNKDYFVEFIKFYKKHINEDDEVESDVESESDIESDSDFDSDFD